MRPYMRTCVIVLEGARSIPELVGIAEAGVVSETAPNARNAAADRHRISKIISSRFAAAAEKKNHFSNPMSKLSIRVLAHGHQNTF